MEFTGVQEGMNQIELFRVSVDFEYLKVRLKGIIGFDDPAPLKRTDNFRKLLGDGWIFDIQFDIVHG